MNVPLRASFTSTWRDWAGITASIGCAIHCAAMPFVIAYLPNLGLSFLADEAFHKWMFMACVLIGLSAFLPGWRKHGRWAPLTLGSAGLAFIGFAAFGLSGECCVACTHDLDESAVLTESVSDCCENGCCQLDGTIATAKATDVEPVVFAASFVGADRISEYAPWITPLGGILLICAHLLNRRYGSICSCCPSAAEVS